MAGGSGSPQRFLVGGLDRMGPEAGRQADDTATQGSRRHTVLGKAPGGYVHG